MAMSSKQGNYSLCHTIPKLFCHIRCPNGIDSQFFTKRSDLREIYSW